MSVMMVSNANKQFLLYPSASHCTSTLAQAVWQRVNHALRKRLCPYLGIATVVVMHPISSRSEIRLDGHVYQFIHTLIET